MQEPQKTEPGPQRLVLNETPSRLRIRHKSGDRGKDLLLSPFEERAVAEGELRQLDLAPAENTARIAYPRANNNVDDASAHEGLNMGLGFAFVLALIGLFVYQATDQRRWLLMLPLGGLSLGILIPFVRRVRHPRDLYKTGSFLARVLHLVFVLLIGIGVPVFGFYHFTAMQSVFDAFVFAIARWTYPATNRPEHLAMILLFSFVVFISALPALLFFLFDRQRARTLYEKMRHCIFRLDGALETMTDVRGKYGARIQDSLGVPLKDQEVSRQAKRFPLLVATLVISIGWLLALLPNLPPVHAELGATSSFDALRTYFTPTADPMTFAFLGAYLFSLRLILRRYARGDLAPKTYTHVTVRMLSVTILAWVLSAVWIGDPRTLLLVAFLTGIMPESTETFLKESAKKIRWPARRNGTPIDESQTPLTELEDIDLYERVRLEEEGITNVASLAHNDPIDLIIRTRIPPPQIMDWVDQSLLRLHTMTGTEDGSLPPLQGRLRAFGLRTATDFMYAYDAAAQDGQLDAFCRRMCGEGADEQGPSRATFLYRALEEDEWIRALRHWRTTLDLGERVMVWDGHQFVREREPENPESSQPASGQQRPRRFSVSEIAKRVPRNGRPSSSPGKLAPRERA